MHPKLKALLGYVPFILFSLAGHLGKPETVTWFAAAAAVATAVILAIQTKEERDPITVVAFGLLSVFAGVALLGGAGGQTWVGAYGFITLHLLTGLVMLVSAFTVPFTEHFARLSVSRDYWQSPLFRAVNRRLSAVWGAAVFGGGLSRILWLLIQGGSEQTQMNAVGVALNWVLPVAFIYAAYRVTARTVSQSKHIEATPGSPAATRP